MRFGKGSAARRVVAVICYLAGAGAVLEIAVLLPYFYPEHTQTWFAERYWPFLMLGFVLVGVAALLWPRGR